LPLAGRLAVASERQTLDINVKRRDQVQIVQLKGPLRLGLAVDSLRQTIEDAVRGGDIRLVLNLSEVPMIDSSGIGMLTRFLATTRQKGGNIKLVNPSKFTIQTLRLVGILNLFEIFEDDDKAVDSFKSGA
jgi:anti-sigma B factor antagonist